MSASRPAFVDAVVSCRREGRPLAAGKLGYSEKALLLLPRRLREAPTRQARAAITAAMRAHAHRQLGAFPDDEESLLEFSERWERESASADFLAAAPGWDLRPAVRDGQAAPTLVGVADLEPDRSAPYDPSNCYLPSFAGARIALVTSMASQLAARAERETFEAVWSRIGMPWFAPASVVPVDFPYLYDERTQARYASAWEVYDEIAARLAAIDYDVALIAAAGLGVPLAVLARSRGAIGISLGGHLQVLFGVQGRRWSQNEAWQRDYVTDAWVRPDPASRPLNSKGLPDDGAYW